MRWVEQYNEIVKTRCIHTLEEFSIELILHSERATSHNSDMKFGLIKLE